MKASVVQRMRLMFRLVLSSEGGLCGNGGRNELEERAEVELQVLRHYTLIFIY